MAKTIVNATVEVDGVDLTTHVSSVSIDKSADDHDVTGLGATAHEHLLGLSEDTITLNFWQDFEASSVDETLSPLQGQNEPFEVTVTEPGGKVWSMNALLPNYSPLSGSAGEPSATECSFVCGDQAGIVENPASGSGSGG